MSRKDALKITSSQTAANIANRLTEDIKKWGLNSKHPAVVTDNAANMVCAVKIMQLMHV